MENLEELKKYLEEEIKDCLELKKKGDLTEEGKGQLALIYAIFQKMGWKIEKKQDE
jgi:hypothetical protein